MSRSQWPAVTIALASLALAFAAVVVALAVTTLAGPGPSTIPPVMPHPGVSREGTTDNT